MEKKEEKIPLIDDVEELFYDSTQQSSFRLHYRFRGGEIIALFSIETTLG